MRLTCLSSAKEARTTPWETALKHQGCSSRSQGRSVMQIAPVADQVAKASLLIRRQHLHFFFFRYHRFYVDHSQVLVKAVDAYPHHCPQQHQSRIFSRNCLIKCAKVTQQSPVESETLPCKIPLVTNLKRTSRTGHHKVAWLGAIRSRSRSKTPFPATMTGNIWPIMNKIEDLH